MQNPLLIIAIVSLLSGLILRIVSRRYLTELGRSLTWYNPKNWFIPPWGNIEFFTKQGLRLHITSQALIFGGVVIYLVGAKL
ncbi:MAG: hypothetical protein ACT6FE_05200 [Methanosarcinaceae archaeon]